MNIKKILKQMTIEDKARLLCGTTPFTIGGFESSAGFIPELGMQDGGTGINLEHLLSRRLKMSILSICAEQCSRNRLHMNFQTRWSMC